MTVPWRIVCRLGSRLSTALALLVGVHLHHRVHGPPVDYVAVGAAAAASWLGVPGPGEPVLIAAALFAARGKVDLPSVLMVAWIGAALGGIAGWLMGRAVGRTVLTTPGPFHRFRVRTIERGERFFDRYGPLAVYLAPTWVAGVNDMSPRRFLLADAVAAAAWTLSVGLGAYIVGPSIADIVSDIGLASAAAVTIVAVGALVLRWRRAVR